MADAETTQTEAVETVTKAQYEALQEKFRREQARAIDYEKKFGGLDIEALKAKAEERDILAREKVSGDPDKVKAEIDRAVSDVRKQLAKEIETRDEKLKRLSSENKELRVVDTVFAQAAGKFIDKAHSDLKRTIRETGDVDESGNIVFKSEKGEILYSKKNPSLPMQTEEFIESLIEEKPHWAADFSIAGAKDAGEKKGATGPKVSSLSQLNNMTPEKQREILASMDPNDVAKLLSGIRF